MPAANLRVARRYAGALFQVARDRNEVDEVGRSLDEVTAAAQADPELLAVLDHPRITREHKRELLRRLFESTVHVDVARFLMLLIDHDRAAVLPAIGQEYRRLVDEFRHELEVHAVSAVPLTDRQIAALRERLQTATGGTLRLTTSVDESILGGLVVRVGDQLVDGSVASRLRGLRDQLKRVKVT